MNTSKRRLVSAAVSLCATVATLWAFSAAPPLFRTGGFGEATCLACHNEFDKPGPGSFIITGVPEVYSPGTVYPIIVTISQDGQSRWGFELSTRYDADRQAGTIEVTDPENTFVRTTDSGIQFLTQTLDGTMEDTPDGPVSWMFDWRAPAVAVGTVYFNAAGLAADGDGTPAGDYVYKAEVLSRPPMK
jgi:hypothetical protein